MATEATYGILNQSQWENLVNNAIESHWDDAYSSVRHVKYQRGGVLPSEMTAFAALAKRNRVLNVIESGRRYGFSSECIIRGHFILTSFEIAPIEATEDRLCDIAASRVPPVNIRLMTGDGRAGIKDEVQRVRKLGMGSRTAVIIDGPKGKPAFELLDLIQPDVAFVAIHDLHKTCEGGEPNISRQLCKGRICYFCEGENFVERLGWLDDEAWVSCGYQSRGEMTKHSSGLGLFPGGKLHV